jgi:hypothetical protein
MYLALLLTALLASPPPAPPARAAGGAATCRVIRRLGYPFTKRADRFREVRYALLDTCPDAGAPAARAVVEVGAGGAKRSAEFEVARFFEDRQEAEAYAREHGVADFKIDADDYLVLPQMRPVVGFFKALETGDFALYRAAFDYDWKPRHLSSPDFWEEIRRRHAGRLRELFGDDYSSAELDFKFTPLDWPNPAGEIDVIYRGRAFEDAMRVVLVEEAGGWKIDGIRW